MKQKDNISRIIEGLYKDNYSEGLTKDLQTWLVNECHKNEKDEALYNYWDKLAFKADTLTYKSLSQVKARLGISGKTALSRKLAPILRITSRIVAVVLPVLLIAGVSLYYLQNREIYTRVAVSCGEYKNITLPDGSEVWLNCGSVLEYPEKMSGRERTVRLKGEAFFDVAKDESRPFTVAASDVSVKVHGTQFNVKTYEDGTSSHVTLLSGSVQVTTAGADTYDLIPGHHLVYSPEENSVSISMHNYTLNDVCAWMSGDLVFPQATFGEILKSLERKFNIPIRTEQSLLTKDIYHIRFTNNESIYEILDVLGGLVGGENGLEYSHHGDGIMITKVKDTQ